MQPIINVHVSTRQTCFKNRLIRCVGNFGGSGVEPPINICFREGANKRGNSSRLTQSFHFFMFEPIFSPVNALNQPI
ncbi:hypothetical protein D2184_26345 [Escherichia coli]|nr:hypothetical protein D2189_24380 [Escherichia coli]RJE95878.1 hypothetical protein D2188_23300 [Escherichia coli]RJF07768.1 hypothetical protein D2186_19145 [Escherichia coli]RJF13251.1 hypothetical protein D2185_19525 [Escherichia coli]RJF13362.1 hypothetical protein D2187_24805 [Escherichia coli]